MRNALRRYYGRRALRRKRRNSFGGQLWLAFPPSGDVAPAFWQRRFYDFNVWSSKKLKEKLDYMHRNAMQRKLVAHPKDWPWSSWSQYAKGERGLIRIDSLEGKSGDTTTPAKKRQNPHP